MLHGHTTTIKYPDPGTLGSIQVLLEIHDFLLAFLNIFGTGWGCVKKSIIPHRTEGYKAVGIGNRGT